MAKITIEFEDINGSVRCNSKPSFADMMGKMERNIEITDAETYALYALRMVREKSKEPKGKIVLPKSRLLM